MSAAGRLSGRVCGQPDLPVKARGRQVWADPKTHHVNRLGLGKRFESAIRYDMLGLTRAEVERRFQVD